MYAGKPWATLHHDRPLTADEIKQLENAISLSSEKPPAAKALIDKVIEASS
jgi:hypothetical protein